MYLYTYMYSTQISTKALNSNKAVLSIYFYIYIHICKYGYVFTVCINIPTIQPFKKDGVPFCQLSIGHCAAGDSPLAFRLRRLAAFTQLSPRVTPQAWSMSFRLEDFIAFSQRWKRQQQ